MSGDATRYASESEYSEFLRFVNEHPRLSYDRLDASFSNAFKLFDIPADERIVAIEKRLDKIISALPSIKRIFSKPIIHLKDKHEVVPIEAVRVINNYTLSHAMIHSELWERDKYGNVKPQKLMTIEKAENYVIYENLIFCKAVDMILSFAKRVSLMLKDILYGCQELNFNLLDRTQHNSYFLAIGKLRKGYSDLDRQYNGSYDSCVNKILLIEKTIRSKLNSPVYLKCKGHIKNMSLKKTNAFRSHKDYRAIYNLLKFFEADNAGGKADTAGKGAGLEQYESYCVLLSLFSIMHFNFSHKKGRSIDLESINEEFSFINWTLTLEKVDRNGVRALRFCFDKDEKYSICVILSEKGEITDAALCAFKESLRANEYLYASSSLYGERDVLYLCIYDIDSFRRIQQIILRGMIYSDKTHTSCAFCGGKTSRTEHGYECGICRARVERRRCEKTSESYWVSEIVRHRSSMGGSHAQDYANKFLHDRRSEAQLHFRNITDINPEAVPICPQCGKAHEF